MCPVGWAIWCTRPGTRLNLECQISNLLSTCLRFCFLLAKWLPMASYPIATMLHSKYLECSLFDEISNRSRWKYQTCCLVATGLTVLILARSSVRLSFTTPQVSIHVCLCCQDVRASKPYPLSTGIDVSVVGTYIL